MHLEHLDSCNKKLRALFEGEFEVDQVTKKRIDAVQRYFYESHMKASSIHTHEKITARYELLILNLTKVKNGELQPEEAVKQINSDSYSRTMNNVVHNLAKVCFALFWAATAISSFAATIGIAIPALFTQPLFGCALGVTFGGTMLYSAHKALSCISEMKSNSRHSSQYDNESSLVSFFKSPKQSAQNERRINQDEYFEDEDLDREQSTSYSH